MSRGMEDRLRAAYQAKAEQVTYRDLVSLRAARTNQLAELLSADLPVTRLETVAVQPSQRRRHSRWLAPAAAAAVVVAVAAAAFALSTTGSHHVVPAPPASRTSSPAKSLSPSVTSSPTSTPSPSNIPSYLAAGQTGARTDVPWSEVGAGWTLAQWSQSDRYSDNGMANPIRDQPESLFLVDPVGGRYLIADFPVGDQWTLVDWSNGGRSALLRSGGSDMWTRVAILDLPTGQLNQLDVPGGMTAESLLGGQDGSSALISTRTGFQQLSTAGQVQLTFPATADGLTGLLDASYSPDRTLVAFGADNGMGLFTAEATFVRRLEVPGTSGGCYPLRWVSGEQIVARCDSGVWSIPVSGASPTRLTPTPSAGSTGPIYDAIPIGTVVLYPVGTSCNSFDLAYAADSQPVSNISNLHLGPAVTGGGIRIVAAQASTVQLLSRGGCGHAGTLTSRNIDSHTDTTLLGGPLNGGGVVAAVGYPDSVG